MLDEISDTSLDKLIKTENFPRNVKIPFLLYEEYNSNTNEKDKKNDEEKKRIPAFDLNKIFQFNFSYNFDLLKNLLETLILNQQESQKVFLKMKKDYELKINEIENKIIDIKIKLSNPNSQYLEELKKEKENIQIESEKIKKRKIKEINLEKEEKENNNNQIINFLKVSRQ